MKIAVIGGGFTGLAAAVRLTDAGAHVTVFEANHSLGGLAGVFRPDHWQWELEKYYHHIFENDRSIIEMAMKVGSPASFYAPLTTSYFEGREAQLDSPLSLLMFSGLSVFSRIRMGLGLLVLKLIPNGLFLEKHRVVDFLPGLISEEGYEKIWQRLLTAKFGQYTQKVNMAWFWSRVAKRTKRLGYFDGGFGELLEAMGKYVRQKGGEIRTRTAVKKIEKEKGKWRVEDDLFDQVILTVPAPIAAENAPESGVVWPKIDYLWGQTLILELKNKLIKGYWMNILEKNWPFLVVVEHTNMVDKKHYGGNEVVYLGNYLPEGDKRLKMTDEQLIALYLPYLKKINGDFDLSWIINNRSFKSPFAQPVFPVNYSRLVPGFRTKQEGVYVANMSMVYPFDRGTNYAVKMGREIADLVLNEL